MKNVKAKKEVQENGNKIVWADGTVTYTNGNGDIVTRKMNYTEKRQMLVNRFTRQRKNYRKGSNKYEFLTALIEKNQKLVEITKPFQDNIERGLELS